MPGEKRIGGGALAVALSMALLLPLGGCGGASESATADPAVVDHPLVYVKRPLPRDEDGERIELDVREPSAFAPGGDLYVRDRAKASAAERNVTGHLTGTNGDVKDPAVSWDGTRVVFALREEDPNPDDDEAPTWDIYEYDLAAERLRRVIADDIVAADGEDIAPAYLPDGRIVFSSTRQQVTGGIEIGRGAIYPGLDEDLNEPAFVLHVMDPDGSDMDQITFNQSHDLDPDVLPDGRIVFVRWENMGGRDGMHLYTVNPDGTDLQLLYGAHSHESGSGETPVQFLSPRPVGNGRILALLRPYTGTDFGGDLVEIDAGSFLDAGQPTAPNQGLTYAGQRSATDNPISTEPGASFYGRFSAFYPLYDGTDRLLVSWTQCLVQDDGQAAPCGDDNPDAPTAAPRYGLWIYTPDGTQLPVVLPEPGWMVTNGVVARARPFPGPGSDVSLDSAMEAVGVIDIRSVYDIAGVDTAAPDIDTLADPAQTAAAERPAHFLRIVKAVPIPDDEVYDFDNTAFGRSNNQLMREIIGYAPVEPDGSVKVQVPANMPLALSVVDARGRRISDRHRGWLQVRPGETIRCNGCHDAGTERAHGRRDAYPAAHDGLAAASVSYPNTDPNLFGAAGETMAQIAYRQLAGDAVYGGRLQPSVDVYYEDIWTDEAAAGRAPDAPFGYRYQDLPSFGALGPDALPVGEACLPDAGNAWTNWSADCRIVIHYPDHIQPLWEVARTVVDGENRAVLQALTAGIDQWSAMEVIDGAEFSCTNCHRPEANGMQAVPAGQLDLTATASDQEAAHLTGYRELLFTDNAQELAGGSLVDRLVETGECQTNADGEPIDDMGNVVEDPANCAPVLATVPVAPVMSVNGALASDGFFALFQPGGSHAGLLTGAEQRLLAEWLDIGGQYYNNPFDAPED